MEFLFVCCLFLILWARRSETGGLCDFLCRSLIGMTKVTQEPESPFNHSLNTELSLGSCRLRYHIGNGLNIAWLVCMNYKTLPGVRTYMVLLTL